MRALSVRQPWASLIASGRKSIEVRSWSTRHRGPLVIVASRRADPATSTFGDGPRGVTVCVVDVVDCRPIAPGDARASCVPAPSGFAWVLANPRSIDQVPIVGRLGLFSLWEEESIEQRALCRVE